MRDPGVDFSRFDNGKRNAVIMMSGGIDSTVLAYHIAAKGDFDHITAFFSNLGVPNSYAEYNSVNRTCMILGFRLIEADFTWVRRALGGIVPAFESDPDIMLPMLGEQSRSSVKMVTACAVIAETTGTFDMFHGSNKEDLKRYIFIPDTFRRIEEMMSLGQNGRQFKIHRPFAEWTRDQVVEEGISLGVPIEDTWSCLSSSIIHCGRCIACKSRKARFETFRKRHQEFIDPTKYAASSYVTEVSNNGKRTKSNIQNHNGRAKTQVGQI